MKKLTVYSMKGCSQCVQAIAMLEQKGVEFEVKKVDEDNDAYTFILSKNLRSMPQVFQGDSIFVENGYKGLTKLTEAEWDALKKA